MRDPAIFVRGSTPRDHGGDDTAAYPALASCSEWTKEEILARMMFLDLFGLICLSIALLMGSTSMASRAARWKWDVGASRLTSGRPWRASKDWDSLS